MCAAPVLLVIAGPAGSGKSTLADRLVAEVSEFKRVVTTTTRAPRLGETDGVHYHFLKPEEFDQKYAEGAFLEWQFVHGFKRYGTLAESVLVPLERGQSLVISIDVQGVKKLREVAETNPLLKRSMWTVFIIVDRERLVARMRTRAKDDELEITARMHTAERELSQAKDFDDRIESRMRDEDFSELLKVVENARRHAVGQ